MDSNVTQAQKYKADFENLVAYARPDALHHATTPKIIMGVYKGNTQGASKITYDIQPIKDSIGNKHMILVRTSLPQKNLLELMN